MVQDLFIALYLLIIQYFVVVQAIPSISLLLISDQCEDDSIVDLLSFGQSCVPLSRSTTAKCCSTISSCLFINPIIFDHHIMDVIASPGYFINIEILDVYLKECGTVCFSSFTYDSGNNYIEKELHLPVLHIFPIFSSDGFMSFISVEHSPSLSTSLKRDAVLPNTSSNVCERFPVKAMLVSFFPGFILGLMIGTSIIYLMNTGRNKKQHRGRSMLGFISSPRLVSQIRSDFLRKQQHKSSICLSDTPKEKRSSRNRPRNIYIHPDEEMNEIPRTPASPEPLIIRHPTRSQDQILSPHSTQRTTTVDEFLGSPLDYRRNSSGLAGLPKDRPHLHKASSYTPTLLPRAL